MYLDNYDDDLDFPDLFTEGDDGEEEKDKKGYLSKMWNSIVKFFKKLKEKILNFFRKKTVEEALNNKPSDWKVEIDAINVGSLKGVLKNSDKFSSAMKSGKLDSYLEYTSTSFDKTSIVTYMNDIKDAINATSNIVEKAQKKTSVGMGGSWTKGGAENWKSIASKLLRVGNSLHKALNKATAATGAKTSEIEEKEEAVNYALQEAIYVCNLDSNLHLLSEAEMSDEDYTKERDNDLITASRSRKSKLAGGIKNAWHTVVMWFKKIIARIVAFFKSSENKWLGTYLKKVKELPDDIKLEITAYKISALTKAVDKVIKGAESGSGDKIKDVNIGGIKPETYTVKKADLKSMFKDHFALIQKANAAGDTLKRKGESTQLKGDSKYPTADKSTMENLRNDIERYQDAIKLLGSLVSRITGNVVKFKTFVDKHEDYEKKDKKKESIDLDLYQFDMINVLAEDGVFDDNGIITEEIDKYLCEFALLGTNESEITDLRIGLTFRTDKILEQLGEEFSDNSGDNIIDILSESLSDTFGLNRY